MLRRVALLKCLLCVVWLLNEVQWMECTEGQQRLTASCFFIGQHLQPVVEQKQLLKKTYEESTNYTVVYLTLSYPYLSRFPPFYRCKHLLIIDFLGDFCYCERNGLSEAEQITVGITVHSV